MRVITLLLVSVFFSITGTAQKVYFSNPGNVWRGYHYWDMNQRADRWICGYNGDTVVKGNTYRYLKGMTRLGIREDTTNGIIYFRFLTPYAPLGTGYLTDTAEHVFFDYNLNIGDTFRVDWGIYHSVHIVRSKGTRFIGGIPYRSWLMWSPNIHGPGNLRYTFIEGLGAVSVTYAPICNEPFENYDELICFKTDSWIPEVSPGIGRFDNVNSCGFGPEAVESASRESNLLIMPNPVSALSKLNVPSDFGTCEVSIFNSYGNLIAHRKCTQGEHISLQEFRLLPGVYLISVSNKSIGKMAYQQFVVN